jgi:hypothetical protein
VKERHNWDKEYCYPYEYVDVSTFSIGQSYEDEPAKDMYCDLCKGTEFNVGQGSYFTALRCVTCKWEVCIHNG